MSKNNKIITGVAFVVVIVILIGFFALKEQEHVTLYDQSLHNLKIVDGLVCTLNSDILTGSINHKGVCYIEIKNGLAHGVMKHLGKWKSIINWKNGRIHGEFIYLYPNKSIKTKGVFKNGKIDKSEKFEYYNPDGSDLSDNQYAFFAEEDEFKYQEKNWTKRYAWGR